MTQGTHKNPDGYVDTAAEWERAEKVPLEEVRTNTNVYPPNAIVMDDTQIEQSAKGGLKGGQKKAKCRKVIPSSCTAFATT